MRIVFLLFSKSGEVVVENRRKTKLSINPVLVISTIPWQQSAYSAQTNQQQLMANLFSSRAPQFFTSSAVILLVVWSADGDCSVGASSKVNLLNDDIHRCDSSFGQIEPRCALNKEILDLLNEKAFLECTVVELVYNFNKKSTASV